MPLPYPSFSSLPASRQWRIYQQFHRQNVHYWRHCGMASNDAKEEQRSHKRPVPLFKKQVGAKPPQNQAHELGSQAHDVHGIYNINSIQPVHISPSNLYKAFLSAFLTLSLHIPLPLVSFCWDHTQVFSSYPSEIAIAPSPCPVQRCAYT